MRLLQEPIFPDLLLDELQIPREVAGEQNTTIPTPDLLREPTWLTSVSGKSRGFRCGSCRAVPLRWRWKRQAPVRPCGTFLSDKSVSQIFYILKKRKSLCGGLGRKILPSDRIHDPHHLRGVIRDNVRRIVSLQNLLGIFLGVMLFGLRIIAAQILGHDFDRVFVGVKTGLAGIPAERIVRDFFTSIFPAGRFPGGDRRQEPPVEFILLRFLHHLHSETRERHTARPEIRINKRRLGLLLFFSKSFEVHRLFWSKRYFAYALYII